MARRLARWMFGIALLACAASAQAQERAAGDAAIDRELDDAIDIVQQRFMKEMTHAQIVERALKALLADLDPYSKYLTPLERRLFEDDLASEFGGMGIHVDFETQDRVPAIKRLMIESPGARAGLRVGDRIVAIDGHPTKGESADDVVGWLRGEPGSTARVDLLRDGLASPARVQVVRERIHVPSVRGARRDADGRPQYMLDPARRIGYLRIHSLAEDTVPTASAAMQGLREAGVRGLVLDLRDCIGGKMHAALGVADLFVGQGRMLTVVQRGETTHYDAAPGVYTDFPVVVLVNAGTVSSGEILAGAMKDSGRAVLVGQRTFGKGRVQTHLPISEGRGSLILSTGTFQRPSGKTIDRHDVPEGSKDAGIAPDVELVVEGDEYDKWIKHASLLDSAVMLSDEEQKPPEPDRVLARGLQEIDKLQRH